MTSGDEVVALDEREWLALLAKAWRFVVPPELVEAATRFRLAGDWRAACLAAGITSSVDLDRARGEYGAAIADRLADDLAHLVPDLVRWHAPRLLSGAQPQYRLRPQVSIVLARYRSARRSRDIRLWIDGPRPVDPQWMTLRFGHSGWVAGPAMVDWTSTPHCWRSTHTSDLARVRSVEHMLVERGMLAPDELHPLVRQALAATVPAPRTARSGLPYGRGWHRQPAQLDDEELVRHPVRVRCTGGQWHEMACRHGVLDAPHSAADFHREMALHALGGSVGGCFAVARAWMTGVGRLPRLLREQRRRVFLRMVHGDAHAVLRMLDAGLDPQIRDRDGRGLRDHLPHLPPPGRDLLLRRLPPTVA